jgi:hypothetical protein
MSYSSERRIVVKAGRKGDSVEHFLTLRRNRPRKKPKTDLGCFDKCVIRHTVNEIHLSEKQWPT